MNPDDPDAFNHRFFEVNGIRMHAVDEGQGPLVILVHGFPYVWYWWRRQIKALAGAGYRVIAIDMRGYGQTYKPDTPEGHSITLTVGDLVGIVKAVNETSAVLMGHDVGSGLVYYAAAMRPDLFRAVVNLCSPPSPRGAAKPSVGWKAISTPDKVFYQLYFQEPGRADRELAADNRKSVRAIMYSVSGSAHGADRWRLWVEKGETIVDTCKDRVQFPAWLSDQAIDYYVSEWTRTGWTGGLDQYRARDRNWELTSFLDGAVVRQPSLFIGGLDDPAYPLFLRDYEQLETHMPGLKKKVLLKGVGHAAAEEQPDAVNELLLWFMRGLKHR